MVQEMSQSFHAGTFTKPQGAEGLFVVFFIVYLVSVGGNLLLMITIVFSPTLGSPMYVFLSCLSFIDTCYSSCMNPKLIAESLYEGRAITFKGFLAQFFVAHLLGGTEIILLTVMAYDHYVTICKPLHYTAVMTRHLCVLLVGLAWLGGFLHSLAQPLLVLQLPFCRLNVINHFVCDLYPLLELAFTDTYVIGLLVVTNSGVICLLTSSCWPPPTSSSCAP